MAVDVNERLLIYSPFTCFCVLYIKLYVRLTVQTSVVRLDAYLKVLTFRLTSTFLSTCCPLRDIRVALPRRKGRAVARAALPVAISVCSVFGCLNTAMAASVWGF